MSLLDVANLPRIQDAQLSPDGQFVSYMLAQADWKANAQVPHIWSQRTGGGPPTQLTRGDAGEALARWSPDSRTLLYLSRGQIWIMSSDGSNARALTRHATGVSQPAWAPSGATIYFVAADARGSEERERDRLNGDVHAFERDDFEQRHLWRVDLASGIERKLTEGAFSVLSYRVSRDGRQIVLSRSPSPLVADHEQSEIWTMNAGGEGPRQVTSNAAYEVEAELSPDNSQILFIAEASDRLEPYYNSRAFVMPATGGQPQPVLANVPFAIDHASWSPDGRSVFAVVNMGVHSEIFRVDIATAKATQLTDGQHAVVTWNMVPAAGRMVFQLDEPTRLGDAWTMSLEGGQPARVTGIYDALPRDFQLPRQEKVTWAGNDGTPIEGLLFYPVGYQAGTRYPLVVQLHGGPGESDKFGYGAGFIMNYVPVLAAAGYAVLRPNYRGSAGYGDAFLRDVVGHYFHQMHLDVLAGVDDVVKRGIADPGRLAVMGSSAGAHLTNKLITVTGRFKAASSWGGVANWVSMFAQTDTRSDRSVWFGGSPWQKDAPVEAFWNNSPIKDVANVTTPTLLIVGENDGRVPPAQSLEMYRGLVANRVPTRLYIVDRETHQWVELRHQLFKANVELEWFDTHVMGRPYRWAPLPAVPQPNERPPVLP